MRRLRLPIRLLLPVLATATLAACSSSGGSATSTEFESIAAGTASTAQVAAYASKTDTDVESLDLKFEQGFEYDEQIVGTDEILLATLSTKVTGQGTIAADGSSALMSASMDVPGFGAFDVEIHQFDGKTWVQNPMTGDWEESPESAVAAIPEPSDAVDLINQDMELGFAGTETIGGQETYRYDAVVVLTEELVEEAQALSGEIAGSDLVGSEVALSIWLGERGMVKFEYRVHVGEQVSAASQSGVELDAAAVSYVLTLEVTGYDNNPLPTGPPASA